jgi:hypothetical protein
VAWQWKAGGAAVTNTAGSISAQVSANPTAGVSIVTWTGTGANATVGHGLGVAPQMVIVKGRSVSGYSWTIWNKSIVDVNGSSAVIALESTSAWFNRATAFNSTAPTSSVFSLGTDLGTNTSGGTFVAYCFSQVAGYSAFGSYTGNGSADGPFIYTGFEPRFVLFKCVSATSHWSLYDSARSPNNLTDLELSPNNANTENGTIGGDGYDLLSNGIKIRAAVSNEENVNGQNYIYMAFAENPFKYANAR